MKNLTKVEATKVVVHVSLAIDDVDLLVAMLEDRLDRLAELVHEEEDYRLFEEGADAYRLRQGLEGLRRAEVLRWQQEGG